MGLGGWLVLATWLEWWFGHAIIDAMQGMGV